MAHVTNSNDLALIVSYSIIGRGRVDVSVMPADTWNQNNPHTPTPPLGTVNQAGPAYNDRITIVGRFGNIADCRAQLRSTEIRLGTERGALTAKLSRYGTCADFATLAREG